MSSQIQSKKFRRYLIELRLNDSYVNQPLLRLSSNYLDKR